MNKGKVGAQFQYSDSYVQFLAILKIGFKIPYSPIPKLLTHSSNSVTKLTDGKIRWIIREKMKEILSTNDIALSQNVSGSRIRQIWSQVQDDTDSTGYLQSLEDRLGVSLMKKYQLS